MHHQPQLSSQSPGGESCGSSTPPSASVMVATASRGSVAPSAQSTSMSAPRQQDARPLEVGARLARRAEVEPPALADRAPRALAAVHERERLRDALEPALGRPCLEPLDQLARRGAGLHQVPQRVMRAGKVHAQHERHAFRQRRQRQRLLEALEAPGVAPESVVPAADAVQRARPLGGRACRREQGAAAVDQRLPVARAMRVHRARVEFREVARRAIRRRVVPHALRHVADVPVERVGKRHHQVELRVPAVGNDLREVAPQVRRKLLLAPSPVDARKVHEAAKPLAAHNALAHGPTRSAGSRAPRSQSTRVPSMRTSRAVSNECRGISRTSRTFARRGGQLVDQRCACARAPACDSVHARTTVHRAAVTASGATDESTTA
jgi:hypothetical protein